MTDQNQNAAWFIDEGVPGIGERPSWLPEKFKTVADLARSNAELEKRFATVPEDYDFSKSKYIDPDYAPFQELRQLAKEKRVHNDVMDKMINAFDKYMDEFSIDKNEELKKLGDNAKDRLVTLDNWAQANLSKDAYLALSESLKSADSIKALEELRGKIMSTTPQVPGNDGQISNAPSLDDIKKELYMNLEKYKKDESYRKDISQRLEVAAKNTPGYVDKVGA